MKNERVIYFKHSLHQLLYLSIILLYNKNDTHTQNWFEEIVLRGSLKAHNSSKRQMHVLRCCESKKFYLEGLSLQQNTKILIA